MFSESADYRAAADEALASSRGEDQRQINMQNVAHSISAKWLLFLAGGCLLATNVVSLLLMGFSGRWRPDATYTNVPYLSDAGKVQPEAVVFSAGLQLSGVLWGAALSAIGLVLRQQLRRAPPIQQQDTMERASYRRVDASITVTQWVAAVACASLWLAGVIGPRENSAYEATHYFFFIVFFIAVYVWAVCTHQVLHWMRPREPGSADKLSKALRLSGLLVMTVVTLLLPLFLGVVSAWRYLSGDDQVEEREVNLLKQAAPKLQYADLLALLLLTVPGIGLGLKKAKARLRVDTLERADDDFSSDDEEAKAAGGSSYYW